jgi:hypothetical protein
MRYWALKYWACALALAVCIGLPGPADAAERKAVCYALGKVFDNPRLQRSLPEDKEQPAPPGTTLPVCNIADKEPEAPVAKKPPGALFAPGQLGPSFRLMFWVIVVSLAGLMLFPLISGGGLRLFRERAIAPTLKTAAEVEAALAEAALSKDPAAAAMQLAEDGLLVEAVRLLVAASIERMRAAGRRIRPDATNREILRGLRRTQDLAVPFGVIVSVEERALWRDEVIAIDDIVSCAEAFGRLEAALAPQPKPAEAGEAA